MTTIVESLWLRLHAVLTDFAVGLIATDPTLVQNVGRTGNDAFLLRAYLGLRRHVDGVEVAITVDVRVDGQRLIVESDACIDDGQVVASGPSTVIPLDGQANVDADIGGWFLDFNRFLLESTPAVMLAASKLCVKRDT